MNGERSAWFLSPNFTHLIAKKLFILMVTWLTGRGRVRLRQLRTFAAWWASLAKKTDLRGGGGGEGFKKSKWIMSNLRRWKHVFIFFGGGKKTWVKNLTAQQVDNMMSRPFFGGATKTWRTSSQQPGMNCWTFGGPAPRPCSLAIAFDWDGPPRF